MLVLTYLFYRLYAVGVPLLVPPCQITRVRRSARLPLEATSQLPAHARQ